MKKRVNYYCINSAYHTYNCCVTCWNTHPKAQKYDDRSMDKEFSEWVTKQTRNEQIAKAIRAGFTNSQAKYLVDREEEIEI